MPAFTAKSAPKVGSRAAVPATLQSPELPRTSLLSIDGMSEGVSTYHYGRSPVQRRVMDASGSGSGDAAVGAARSYETGLPSNLRSGMQALSGLNLDGVKVHYNSAKPAGIGALAYAQGSDIHLAPRQEKHLPHEAWHVVQQLQGRVHSTLQQSGTAINDEAKLESEATAMGQKALLGQAMTEIPAQRQAKPSSGSGVVQRILSTVDEKELEAFYLREIRTIGSPYSKSNWAIYQQALAEDDLDDAKQIIRTHIAQWFKELDEGATEWREPGETAAITSTDLARLGVKRGNANGGNQKALGHREYTKVKGLSRKGKLTSVAEVSDLYPITPYEEGKRRNTDVLEERGVLRRIDQLAQIVRARPEFAERIAEDPELSMGGQIGVFYRYHKFGKSDRSELVFGGFFNKSDIDSDVPGDRLPKNTLHSKAIAPYFKKRRDTLSVLSEPDPHDPVERAEARARKVKVLEQAQANARDTPFIATTSTKGYGQQLLTEYPPDEGQYAVMLTILGPVSNTLDFESEFRSLNVGWAEDNYRVTADRVKDKQQAEFGIPEVFIPLGERSPLGFVIAHVERLS